ncbi:bHLH domain-containing protein [Phanerochaete sordida]|uniref:BHLH domain-containing protein n=1 Tax=Phanerochaete sordida TaxID=48140 RepID=A0A9P3LBI7_9APHY|nr:bHLH domain-containing protein [Phanerochaete sordida]
MALLTHSETLAFNGFLSSIDFGDALEWSGITPDKLPLIPSQGKEAALAKATKDLMSLEATIRHDEQEISPHHKQQLDVVSSSWPGLPEELAHQQQQGYTYGFNVNSSSRPSRRSTLSGEQRRPSPHDIFAPSPTSHSPAFFDTPGSSSSSYPSSETQASGSRPSPFAAASAPAALNRSRSGSKRSLADSDWPGASAKRRRPSVLAEQPGSPALDAARARSARASSVSSNTTVGGTPRDAEAAPKPALLSPSQKRANHIQSEQKRRANIRKGYEALCEVVPALRDAIRAEDERARAAEDDSRKRKKKAKNGADESEKPDGRAGPKSENVVLSKTIDHLNELLAERMTLTARLHQARAALMPGHPALHYMPNHVDDKGVPLWEREWTGGTGWGDAEDDAGDDDS